MIGTVIIAFTMGIIIKNKINECISLQDVVIPVVIPRANVVIPTAVIHHASPVIPKRRSRWFSHSVGFYD